jgi:hypothetical protein
MIQLLSANGTAPYGLYKFAIDSIDDLVNLPKGAKMGSEAIVTATSETYIKNGNGEWVLKPASGGGGGGAADVSPIPETTINSILNTIFGKDGEKI